MRRALVTGASGFIGRHVVRALQSAGWSVRTLHRGEPLHEISDHVRADIATAPLDAAVSEVDAVIHLAGLGDVAAAARDPLGYNLVNAVGTLRVLEACRLGGASMTFASSQHVYRPSSGRLSETAQPSPQHVYGASKLIAEQWCEMFGRNYGLPTRVMRLFSVYGPGQAGQGASGVVPLMTQRALQNEPIVVMSPQRRDFTHVDDVTRGVLSLLELQAPGFDRFNIATGRGTSFARLAWMIRDLTGSDSPIDKSGITETSGHLVPDVSRARAILGFEATVPLYEGLRRYCDDARTASLRSA